MYRYLVLITSNAQTTGVSRWKANSKPTFSRIGKRSLEGTEIPSALAGWFFIISLVISAKCFAQSVSASDLDAVARSSKGTSIMFAQPLSEEDIAYQEEMKAREQYERAMREKEAYEQEMRARKEAMEKAEKERQRALRPVNLFGNSLKMYAVVNGEVITSRDMQDRANAFVATTQIPITSQNKQMVLERVLQGAVDEKIKLQEAKKNGIEITDQELNTGMQNFAKSNGLSVSEFKKMLKSAEVDEKAFKEQLKSEMAWARLVQSKASQSVKVSRSEVKKVIDSITRDTQKQKFMVSEIVIHKKDGAHISELVQILRQDPRFELYAMQFSQSATAKNGGSLGWVSSEQLVTQLSSKLAKMKEGDVSEPILVGSDYYILKLEKKYTPGVDKMPIPSEKEVKEMLENKKMEEVAEKYLRDLRNKAIIERKA